MRAFRDEGIWRILSGFWTVVFIAFVVVNPVTPRPEGWGFFQGWNSRIVTPPRPAPLETAFLTGPEGRCPLGSNGVNFFLSELFVIIWSVVILALLVLFFVLGSEYKVLSEVMADYIMVLTIFALTQKSKQFHELRIKRKRGVA